MRYDSIELDWKTLQISFMQISEATENDIAKIGSPKPITFLASNADGRVRVIHISYTSKNLSMVADIDLATNKVALSPQDDARTFISVFIGHNCNMIDGYRELETSGCDLSFITHCEEIVKDVLKQTNGQENYPLYNLLLHIQSIRYNYVYFSADIITDAQTIVKKIDQLYYMYFTNLTENSRSRCYCGITNNLDRRMQEHRDKDFGIYDDKVFAIVCRNNKITAEAEYLLSANYSISKSSILSNDNGASSAGNGAAQDTCIVYLLMPVNF